MRIRKFECRDMREAVASVKRELGPEAIILSARTIRRGLLGTPLVEVTAGVDVQELDSSTADKVAAAAPPPVATAPMPRMMDELDVERIVGPLKAEMRSIRALVRQQSDPSRSETALRSEITALRSAVEELQRIAATPIDPMAGLPEPKEIAEKSRLTADSTARIIAIVGPSGVGKTTTIAKLACREALVSRRRVGMITTDVYRVGAIEQIRAYADLIGVPLEIVSEANPLEQAIARLGTMDRIFVDTGGRSPMDIRSLHGLATATGQVPGLEVHLAITASSNGGQIDQVVTRYAPLGPARLIFTKCDEAEDLRELVYAPARIDIPVFCITTGQRVPEDLEAATPARLLELAERGQQALAVAA